MQYGLAAISLVLLAPLCLIIGLLIKVTSPGPILYRGLRVSNNGRIFTLYKFRTLDVGAKENIGARLLTDCDAHYTCIGKVLKRMKLDALPQLVNVLNGDMTLAGLRPRRPLFLEKLCDHSRRDPIRFAIKLGMMGLA
jgi:lipopolysaccharide/colanic/teichoic acid biosynthesis glycosyltransferase